MPASATRATLPPSALAALALLALAGCRDNGPAIGQVSGTVTRGGKPVPNLTVNFVPDRGRPSWGMTDSGGHYSLHWDEDYDGAEVGPHKVTVAFVPGSGPEAAPPPGYEPAGARKKTQAAPPGDIKEITAKYGDLEKTPLTFEVKRGRQTLDLPLD